MQVPCAGRKSRANGVQGFQIQMFEAANISAISLAAVLILVAVRQVGDL
jgi:hypothetical protein